MLIVDAQVHPAPPEPRVRPWPSRPLWRTFLDEHATSLATRQEAVAMLSREDNELLTRVDPGTPMGINWSWGSRI